MVTTVPNQRVRDIDRNPSFVGEDIQPIRLPILQISQDEVRKLKLSFEAKPKILQFQSFIRGRTYALSTQIKNSSTGVLRMYVTNPITKWFTIAVNKEHNLLPGLYMVVTIKFKPDEERYYYDYIKISSQTDDSLYIPIHAFVTEPKVYIPSRIELQQTSVGECTTKVISISCMSPIDLKFTLKLKPQLSFVSIEPTKGILSFTGQSVDLVLSYKPQILTNFQQSLLLTVTNVDMNILTCKIRCEASQKSKLKFLSKSASIQAADRLQMLQKKLRSDVGRSNNLNNEQKVTMKVAQSEGAGLFSTSGKISHKQVRKAKSADGEKQQICSRQAKEKKFLESIKKKQDDEKMNQLKWQTTLGTSPLSLQERRVILTERENHWQNYREEEGIDGELALRRCGTECLRKLSHVEVVTREVPLFTFNLDKKNEWSSRFLALNRFIQGAWKIMARYRADKRLAKLRKFLRSGHDTHKSKTESEVSVSTFKWNIENFPANPRKLFWNQPEQMNLLFPKLQQRFTVGPLSCEIQYKPQPVEIKTPLLHEILGYKPFDVYKAKTDYVPLFPKPPPHPECPFENFLSTCSARDLKSKKSITLSPPENLFKPEPVDAYSVFNPFPDISFYHRLPPSTELEHDYPLYPLNTWRTSEQTKLSSSIDEITERVFEWKNYTLPSQAYFDQSDGEQRFESGLLLSSKKLFPDLFPEPKLEESVSHESKKLFDPTSVRFLENYPLTPALLEKVLEEITPSRDSKTTDFSLSLSKIT